jgi:ankyrin repeat protein
MRAPFLVVLALAASAAAGEEKNTGEAFVVAIANSDLAAVKALVEAGNPADTPIVYGESRETPLLKAADAGKTDIVKYLISKGANVNFRTRDFGRTPLMMAVSRGFDDVVEILLKAGADPKVRDHTGDTAFALAALEGQYEIAEVLLKAGEDVNGSDDSGNTWLTSCGTTGNPTCMRWLVAHGADVNKVSGLQYGGSTALTSAAMVGNAESVRTLLELGANPHLKMKDGGTALSHAQESKNAEVVALVQAALAKAPPAAPAPRRTAPATGAAPAKKPSPHP